MTLARFTEERRARWDELAALVQGRGTRVDRLDAAQVRRLGTLHRSVSADLAVARRRYPGDPVTARLERLVGDSRTLVHATPTRAVAPGHFLTTGYWRRVRERPRFLLVAFLLLWGSTLGTAVWAHGHPDQAARIAEATTLSRNIVERGPRRNDRQPPALTVNTSLSTQIFTNNIRVAFMAFAGGLTGGLLTVASTLFNGGLVGVLSGWVIAGGAGEPFFRLIVPHGFLEWSLFTVACASGLRMGAALLHPGHRTRAEAMATEGRAAVEVAVGTAFCLVPCGLVEGFVTPRNLPLPAGLAVGLALAGTYWALVLWRGRPEPSGGKAPRYKRARAFRDR